jgi:hypothetical protein
MNALKRWTLPSVASASSAAEANGVCTEVIAPESTSASSRTRNPSRRFSLLL